MFCNIYYGVGPTFQTHIAKHGFPRKGDLLFDKFDYGKKIKIENHDFTVLNPAENIDLLTKGQIIICSSGYKQIREYLEKLKPNSSLNIKISDTQCGFKLYKLNIASVDIMQKNFFEKNKNRVIPI